MKTLKRTFIITCLAFLSFGIVSAKENDKTQTRNITGFNAIKVSTGIDLYLQQGDTEKVTIVADEEIINNVKTEVKGQTLHIYTEKKSWFNWNSKGTKKVYVTVKELIKLEASSGSDVRTENTLKGEELAVNANSGSDVYLDVIIKNLSVKTSSGSDAKLQGKVKTLNVASSSGSDIKAGDLESKICHAEASSGSDIVVNVSDEFYGKASSGSDIFYSGSPTTIDSNESSGGDIHHKR